MYLAVQHFRAEQPDESGRQVPPAKPAWGLSAFWATIVRVEFINIAFSVDSILVAVALSPKLAVVVTGGILGIIAMRIVAGQLIALLRRYPALVDGAFVIIGVGGHQAHARVRARDALDWVAGARVGVARRHRGHLRWAAYLYARGKGPQPDQTP